MYLYTSSFESFSRFVSVTSPAIRRRTEENRKIKKEEMNSRNKTNTCAVASCPSPSGQDTIYHRFPHQDASRTKQWLLACKRLDSVNPRTAMVCSNHFIQEDYQRDLRNELLGIPLRKKLKSSAIPRHHLSRSPDPEDSSVQPEPQGEFHGFTM